MKFLYTTILLLFTVFCGYANTKQAESLFADGKYNEALVIYQGVLDNGEESAALYYNIANCYYKLGENTKAILFYERSLLLNPSDKVVKYNLQMAERGIVDKLEVLPEIFFVRWYKSFVSYLSVDEWAYLSVGFFFCFLVLLTIYLYSHILFLRKSAFVGGIFAFVFTIIAIVFSVKQNKIITDREYGIIVTPSVTIKGSPDQSGTELFLIHEGLKVKIIDELGLWYNIQLRDGNEGWISKVDLEII